MDEWATLSFKCSAPAKLADQRVTLLTSLGEWLHVLVHHIALPGQRKTSGAGFTDVQWSFELESDGGKTRALWDSGRASESFDTLDLLERALRAYQTEISRAVAEGRIATRLPGQVTIPLGVQSPPKSAAPVPRPTTATADGEDVIVFEIRRSEAPKD
jgi:hypothetical protein